MNARFSIIRRSGGRAAAKLLLAVALVTGGQTALVQPAFASATTQTSLKIQSKEEAVQEARQSGLLPEGAVMKQVLQQNSPAPAWSITFSSPEKTSGAVYSGSIQVEAATGEPVQFSLSSAMDRITRPSGSPGFDAARQKISYEQAVRKAEAFMDKQMGVLPDEWIIETSPESAYSTRYESDAYHKIRYNIKYGGIRVAGMTSKVFVDRSNGEVAAYQLQWKRRVTALLTSKLTIEQSGKLIFEQMEVVVDAPPTGSAGHEPVYSLYGPLLVNAVTGAADSSEPPPYRGAQKPSYPASLAKKRLLSLYDLELQYLNDGKELAYKLKLKPGVPLYDTGPEPSIGAVTGKWQNYMGAVISTPLPQASGWLLHAAASPDQITYRAGIVLNGKLLGLSANPVVRNNRALIPFRELFTEMGAKIKWDKLTSKVTVQTSQALLEFTIGSDTAKVNGKSRSLSAPAQLIDGRTYIPVRFAAEAAGAKVKWVQSSRLAVISTHSTIKLPNASELDLLRFEQQLMYEELVLQTRL